MGYELNLFETGCEGKTVGVVRGNVSGLLPRGRFQSAHWISFIRLVSIYCVLYQYQTNASRPRSTLTALTPE